MNRNVKFCDVLVILIFPKFLNFPNFRHGIHAANLPFFGGFFHGLRNLILWQQQGQTPICRSTFCGSASKRNMAKYDSQNIPKL